MIFSRVVIVLNKYISLQSTPIAIARRSPRKIWFNFLWEKKQNKIKKSWVSNSIRFCKSPITLKKNYHAFLTIYICNRIETVAKSKFTALHGKNLTAIPVFVAPPTLSDEQVFATMHQLFDRNIGYQLTANSEHYILCLLETWMT